MSKHVIAIDPGEHIGLAVKLPGPEDAVLLNMILFNDKSHPDGLSHLVSWLKALGTEAEIVIERFATASHLTKPAHNTILTVGVVTGYCLSHSIKLTLQSPQARYPFLDIARKAYPGHAVHEIDAYAHLLKYLYDQGK